MTIARETVEQGACLARQPAFAPSASVGSQHERNGVLRDRVRL
jgi:hypothetical protein